MCYIVLMNIGEMRQRLHDICFIESGSARAWAKKNGIAHSYVSAVIRGDARPGNKILKLIGLKKSFSLKKTKVMKFEDIG